MSCGVVREKRVRPMSLCRWSLGYPAAQPAAPRSTTPAHSAGTTHTRTGSDARACTHAHETERRPCTCASRAQARTRLTRLATMQRLALHATPGGGTTPRGGATSTEQAHRSDYDLTLTYS